jgi:hypothetical protein
MNIRDARGGERFITAAHTRRRVSRFRIPRPQLPMGILTKRVNGTHVGQEQHMVPVDSRAHLHNTRGLRQR